MVDQRLLSMQPRIDQYEHYTDIGPAVASAGAAAEWKKASGTYGAIICASASTERERVLQTDRETERQAKRRACDDVLSRIVDDDSYQPTALPRHVMQSEPYIDDNSNFYRARSYASAVLASVCLSHACSVTKPYSALRIF